jgi:multiple sugar transport system permease protein
VTSRRAARAEGAAWYGVSITLSAFFLLPLVAVLITVFKTPADAVAVPPTYLPSQISFENFGALWSAGAGLPRYLANSALVAVGTVLVTIVLATLAGYGIARIRFRGANAIFLLLLSPMMVPLQALLTPLYTVLLRIGLSDSLVGLVLIYSVSILPFSVFVMRNAFADIPREIEEAAWVDGCGVSRSLLSVALPLAWPGIATVALFAFFTAWNEFLAALVLLTSDSHFTVPLLLQNITIGKLGSINWGMLQVGILVTALPCVVVFLLLQRYYVRGLLAGGVKG